MKRNVNNPESISDHMYRMGLMALIAPDIPGIDRDKLVFFFFFFSFSHSNELHLKKKIDGSVFFFFFKILFVYISGA